MLITDVQPPPPPSALFRNSFRYMSLSCEVFCSEAILSQKQLTAARWNVNQFAHISATDFCPFISHQGKFVFAKKDMQAVGSGSSMSNQQSCNLQDVWLESRDKTKLHAWLIFPKGWTARERKRHTTIIFLQENAGNMSMRLPYLADLLKFYPCTIAAVE